MISVIIPAYNAGKIIGECLAALKAQTFSGEKEIIVVDDGSTDNTAAVAESFGVKVVRQEHAGPAVARNKGVKESKGNIIVFTDADCVADSGWLENMVKPFSDPTVSGVAGTYRTKNEERLIAKFAGYEIELRHERMKKFGNIDFIGTYSAAYRKDAFLKFGGFNSDFATSSGEDPELSFRMAKAGLKLVFNSKAFVYHRHPATLVSYLRQKFQRGYWRVLLYKKHPSKLRGESYTPPTLFVETAFTNLAILSAAASVVFGGPFYIATALLILATLIINIKFYFFMLKKEIKTGLVSVPVSLLRNVSYGAGIVGGLLNSIRK